MTPHAQPASPPRPPPSARQELHDNGGGPAERMRGAGGAVHRAGIHLPRGVTRMKAQPVPMAEHGVLTPTLRHRLRAAVAPRAEQILPVARPRGGCAMPGPG
jgi:hypothetical protein